MLTIRDLNDVLQVEQTPLEKYLPEQTTYDIIRRSAEKFPNRAALIFLPAGNALADLEQQTIKSVYSYQELFTGIQQTIQLLLHLGVGKGDVVSYLLPNSVENYFILYAAQAVGIANPISPVLPPEQLLTLLQSAESKILITLDEHTYPELWKNILQIRQRCPKLKKIWVINEIKNLITQKQTLPWDPTQIKPDDICSYFHTSGTTGTPKLAKHTHLGNVYMAWAMGIFTEYAQPDTVVLSGLPMFHVGAPMISGLAAFYYGATVVVISPFGWMDSQVIANFWKIIEKYNGTSTAALPFVFRILNQTPVNNANISSLRQAISGMAVSAYDFNLFKNKTGIKIANLWGQTEITSIGSFNPAVDPEDLHFGSMGIRLPFEQIKVSRFNAQGEYLRDCAVGEEGILCVSGPHVSGYRQKNWHNTGDWVRQEADGYLTFLGRDQDFIQHPDQIISLLEIERIACEHPEVAEASAISVKNPQQDLEMPVLFFTLQPNAQLTSEQLHHWLKMQAKLSAEALPVQVIRCQTLPKNGMGKPLKYLLKNQLGLV